VMRGDERPANGERSGPIGVATLVRAVPPPRPSAWRIAWALLRCRQWLKNTFVFAGLLFGGRLDEPAALAAAAVAFVAFSLLASATYIHNDIVDRAVDRRHPTKRARPIAAGTISVRIARLIELGLLAAGAVAGALLGRSALLLLVAYVALNLAYNVVLKRIVLLDVFAIAAGFVLRVEVGCVAVGVVPSVWILLCTFVLSLLLGFGKRRHELVLAGPSAYDHRPALGGYSTAFLDQMIGVTSASTIACYAMFTVWPGTLAAHGTDKLFWTVPFVLYGLFRYQLLVYTEGRGDDPTELVFTDRPLMATLLLWLLACVAILYWR